MIHVSKAQHQGGGMRWGVPRGKWDTLTGSKPNVSTLGLLIRQCILKVSTFIPLGFGPVDTLRGLRGQAYPSTALRANVPLALVLRQGEESLGLGFRVWGLGCRV